MRKRLKTAAASFRREAHCSHPVFQGSCAASRPSRFGDPREGTVGNRKWERLRRAHLSSVARPACGTPLPLRPEEFCLYAPANNAVAAG
jgi:hypothetical protein